MAGSPAPWKVRATSARVRGPWAIVRAGPPGAGVGFVGAGALRAADERASGALLDAAAEPPAAPGVAADPAVDAFDPRVHPATTEAAAAAARPSTARRLTVIPASCRAGAEGAPAGTSALHLPDGTVMPVAGTASGPIGTPGAVTPTPVPPAGPPAPAAPVEDRERAATPWWRRPGVLLAAVAVVHAALPLALLGWHWFIGIDESVYLSQINAHVPPGGFSAPRARGSTFIAAPVTLFTDSIPAMRVWTSLLSGVGLFLAFRPWLRLRPGYVVPLAAAMFASIWTVTYYGFQVMPNLWLGYAVVGACGSLVWYLLGGRWTALAGVAAAMAFAALLRPSDAAFAAVPLGLVCLLTRVPWRRRLVALALLAVGTVAGIAQWVIEAYTTYGGLHARLHAAEAEQGGSGLYFSAGAQARALAGPLLCRGGCHANAALIYRLWWVAAAVLIVVAVVTIRRRRPVLELAPLALGAAMAAQYVFAVGYAAPRFLVPAYAAAALPAASGAAALVRAVPRPRLRFAVAGAMLAVLAAHAVLQLHVISAFIEPGGRISGNRTVSSASVLRRHGLHDPCVVVGQTSSNGPLAYVLRCSNRKPDAATLLADVRGRTQVVWLRNTPPSSHWGVRWTKVRLHWLRTIDAYISPPAR